MFSGFCALQFAQVFSFMPLSLLLFLAVPPSLCIVLLFCNILRPKDNFPLPPTGEHKALEAD